MSERRCEVTELLVDQCAHCTGRDGREELPLRSSVTFVAAYAGRCAHCGRPFDEGAQLVRSDEVDGYCLLDHTVPRSIDR